MKPTIDSGELLEILGKESFLTPYSLSFQKSPVSQATGEKQSLPCGQLGQTLPCQGLCRRNKEKSVTEACETGHPVVFSCPIGLLHFAVPLPAFFDLQGCLLGSGARESVLPLAQLAALSNADCDAISLLDRLERIPVGTREETAETAKSLSNLLPSLLQRNVYAAALEQTSRRLEILAEVSTALDGCHSSEAVLELLCETMVILYDIPRIAAIVSPSGTNETPLQRTLGFEAPPDPERLKELFSRWTSLRVPLETSEISDIFPNLSVSWAAGFLLAAGEEAMGMVAVFDATLSKRDQRLAELLAGRAAVRLHTLQAECQASRNADRSEKLLKAIGALAVTEDRADLNRHILSHAADLLKATSGSLMLLDEDGDNLCIEAAIGLNPALRRSMRLKVGTGIAGKVAQSGKSLLVNDIEKDTRVGMTNRPRFKTKSFISAPLVYEGKTFGVLNLADKERQDIFNAADLDLLTKFTVHASVMVDRVKHLEQARKLEELSVTDPLTGLYNRRFLNKRLEEEFSRSKRHNLSFTVILLDIDHFKKYNDSCGHLAGDRALQKTAELLRRSAREMDVLTRYGGEEFCLLLPSTGKRESLFVAERVRRGFEKEPFPGENHLPGGRLTASIGVASFPEDGSCAEELIDAADKALYRAKDQGRNNLVVFDQVPRQESK